MDISRENSLGDWVGSAGGNGILLLSAECDITEMEIEVEVIESNPVKVSKSHDRSEETPEAKARWFQSLSLPERMELLCEFTDLILSNNPSIVDSKNAEPAAGRVLIVSEARR